MFDQNTTRKSIFRLPTSLSVKCIARYTEPVKVQGRCTHSAAAYFDMGAAQFDIISNRLSWGILTHQSRYCPGVKLYTLLTWSEGIPLLTLVGQRSVLLELQWNVFDVRRLCRVRHLKRMASQNTMMYLIGTWIQLRLKRGGPHQTTHPSPLLSAADSHLSLPSSSW